jgi:hypothetical protein
MKRLCLILAVLLSLAFASEANACCRRAPVRRALRAAGKVVKFARPKNVVKHVKARRHRRQGACHEQPACEPVGECVGACPVR